MIRSLLLVTLLACGSKDSSNPPATEPAKEAAKTEPVKAEPPPAPKKSKADCDKLTSYVGSLIDLTESIAESIAFRGDTNVTQIGWELPAAKGKPHEAALTALHETAKALETESAAAKTAATACKTAFAANSKTARAACEPVNAALDKAFATHKKVLDGLDAAKIPAKSAGSIRNLADKLAADHAELEKVGVELAQLDGC